MSAARRRRAKVERPPLLADLYDVPTGRRLPAYKLPEQLLLVDALPTTSTGGDP